MVRFDVKDSTENALDPIDVTLLGIVTAVSSLQYEKQPTPMLIKESGNVTTVSDLQYWKA